MLEHPTPAIVLAALALFVSMSGTAAVGRRGSPTGGC
jgi:hypothetical protein